MPGEVELSSSPIRRQAPDVKYPKKVERQPDIIAAVRHLDKVEMLAASGCEISGCMSENFHLGGMSNATRRKGDRLRVLKRGSHAAILGRIPHVPL